jgi:hypothetical protein
MHIYDKVFLHCFVLIFPGVVIITKFNMFVVETKHCMLY